jgi:hypothetical protein
MWRHPAASLDHNSNLSASGIFWHIEASKNCKPLMFIAYFGHEAAIFDLRVCTAILVVPNMKVSDASQNGNVLFFCTVSSYM